ncbi:MAG: acyltransferase [Syntrophomonadaceae bacterium]|jgi:surface polysaccharide O-acyltransferase-like enzyme|nr:acyltransferase [Syntrophomonadaceae bacterium]
MVTVKPTADRRHYLDNIRWGTVVLVLIYHVFYLYNTVGVPFPIAEDAGIRAFDTFSYIVYPWFMVILFLVSGISARYALQNQTNRQFLKNKVTKLLVPSTLGLVVFHWISGYLNIKFGGGLASIPDFIRYPVFVVAGTGPLWFLQMLFLFSGLLVLIRKIDKKDKIWTFCGKINLVIILLLVFLIWGSAQILNLPILTTYRFGIYSTAYLIGYFIFSHDEVQDSIEKIHILMLIAAVILGIAYTVRYFGVSYSSQECLTSFLTNCYLWAAVLAILGCGRAWCDKTSAFASYMTRSSFGLYVVHYLVVQLACYSVYHYSGFPRALNYFFALAIELPCTVLLYELLRRVPVIRYLVLGIKVAKQ